MLQYLVLGLFAAPAVAIVGSPLPAGASAGVTERTWIVDGEVLAVYDGHNALGDAWRFASIRVDDVVRVGQWREPSGVVEVRVDGAGPARGAARLALEPALRGQPEGGVGEGWDLTDFRQGCCWESRAASWLGALAWVAAGVLLAAAWGCVGVAWRSPWTWLPVGMGVLMGWLILAVYFDAPGGDAWFLSEDGEGNVAASAAVTVSAALLLAGLIVVVAAPARTPAAWLATTASAVVVAWGHVFVGQTYDVWAGRGMWVAVAAPLVVLVLAAARRHEWLARPGALLGLGAAGAALAWFIALVYVGVRFPYDPEPADYVAGVLFFVVPVGLPALLLGVEGWRLWQALRSRAG